VVVGPRVRIGARTIVSSHVVIECNTTIGKDNRIFPFAMIGAATPDLKFRGEPSTLEIGDHNTIREFTSLHRGTEAGGMVTRIGSGTLIMPYVHVAHDCTVGDHTILVNSTQLAGHCITEEYVTIEGLCGVQQFCRIGAHAFLAAGSRVERDVPPYSRVAGDRARLIDVNVIGLQRRGFAPETIAALRAALRTIFYSKLSREESLTAALEEHAGVAEVGRLVEFIRRSERGVVSRERD